MLASLSSTERHDVTWGGSALLAETLRDLARAVDAQHPHDREFSSTVEAGGE